MITASRKIGLALGTMAVSASFALAGPASAQTLATEAAPTGVSPSQAGSTLATDTGRQGAFAQQAKQAGLSTKQADALQKRVDRVLGQHSQAKQVSANKVLLDGASVTLRAPGQKVAHNLADGIEAKGKYICKEGHLCMRVHGNVKDFWKCKTWRLKGWTGDGPFVNNQTDGTVARFYNQDGSERWHSVAFQRGTATWDPIWSIKVC